MSAVEHFEMRETRRRLRAPLVVAIAVLLIASSGLRSRSDDGAPRASSVASADPAAGLPDATLDVSARGVETNATVVGINSVTLGEPSSITIEGHLPGEDVGARRISATDTRFTLSGRDMTLEMVMLVRPREVLVSAEGLGGENLTARGRVTLRANRITSMVRGRTDPEQHRGSLAFIVDGPGEIRPGMLNGEKPVGWLDAPATIRLRDDTRSITDWAGTGTVRLGGRDYTHGFGGLAARRLEATVRRGPGTVTVSGRGRAQQVYLDGEPQLRTTASCDLIQVREETVAGQRLELTWAPRNTGDFDMVMTRIVPIGPAASWLSLGLGGLLNEFGGEMRPARRGDTTGFRDGQPIRSLLPPFDADRRDIGVAVPLGTPNGTYDASVRIEGNFDPVVVPFKVIVVAPAAPRNEDEFPRKSLPADVSDPVKGLRSRVVV